MSALKTITKWLVIVLVALAAIAGLVAWYLHTDISDERMRLLEQSPYFEDGAFFNEERQAASELGMAFFREQFFGDQQREPEAAVPMVAIDPATLRVQPSPGLRAKWLGHASVLLEIDGYRVLTDPVLSQRASPFPFLGPARTHAPPIALGDLTGVDAVVISHNHYDHLDEATVRHLAAQGTRFFVPLGVGQYLEDWGIPGEQVAEMQWWEQRKIGNLTITAMPNRHYSSRGLFDYKATHWSSWSIAGETHKAFYSGDTGYSKHFREIGERIGPFDLSIIKVGSYGPGQAWTDIHMTPEEAVQVHLDIDAERMLPVHWMTFNLAIHEWDEPIRRTLAAAAAQDVAVVAPKIGQVVEAGEPFANAEWWELVE